MSSHRQHAFQESANGQGTKAGRSVRFKPYPLEMFLFICAGLVAFMLVGFYADVGPGYEATAPGPVQATYTVLVFVIWLVALPVSQSLLIRRFSGVRPRIFWFGTAVNPEVFGLLYAPEARFGPRQFALLTALPALYTFVLMLPISVLGIMAGVGFLQLLMVVAGSVALYFLRYAAWALGRPEDSIIETTHETGVVVSAPGP